MTTSLITTTLVSYSILLLLLASESLFRSRTKLNIKHQTNNLHLNNYDWNIEYLTIK